MHNRKLWILCVTHLLIHLNTILLLPNMSKNSAVHQKKVKSAVRVLQTTTGVKVLQAMILPGFLKSDLASKTVHQMVRRRCRQKQNKAHAGQPTPTNGIVLISNKPLLSELTVIADPTKWHKPNPPSFVDSCVPNHHHCPPSLLVVIVLVVVIMVIIVDRTCSWPVTTSPPVPVGTQSCQLWDYNVIVP